MLAAVVFARCAVRSLFFFMAALIACHQTPKQFTPAPASLASVPVASLPVSSPTKPPAPSRFTLSDVGDEKIIDGLTIQYSDRRHKHGEGFTVGIVELTFTHDGKTEVQELRGERNFYRAEWLVFDRLIVVAANANDASLSLIVSTEAAKPLTREDAMSILIEAAAKQGLSSEGDNSSRLEYGVLLVSFEGEPGWSGQIGTLSHEIYELQKLPKEKRRSP
jgi:hypothetical protein